MNAADVKTDPYVPRPGAGTLRAAPQTSGRDGAQLGSQRAQRGTARLAAGGGGGTEGHRKEKRQQGRKS